MARSDITINVEPSPDGVTVGVRGELDIATAPYVDEALEKLWREGTATTLDLAAVDFLDSTALRVLLMSTKRAKEDGWAFRIIALQPQVRRAIELMGLLPVLPLGDE